MHMKSAPQAGAILFAYLPEEGSAQKSKPRPVVVLDSTERNGLIYLTVAKGTSQKTNEKFRGEFVVRNAEDLVACGLVKETKFQLRRTETLPFTNNWFCMKASGNIPRHLVRNLLDAAQEANLI